MAISVKFDTILQKLREKDTTTSSANVLEFSGICTASEAVGDPVYLDSSGFLRTADASTFSKSKVVGFIVSKASPTTCVVRISGTITLSGLTPGVPYFLGIAPTTLTATPPTGAGSVINCLGIGRDSATFIILIGSNLTVRS